MPDVLKIAGLNGDNPLALALYRPLGGEAGSLGFKVYRRGGAVVLSDSLPMLEHMGVRVLGEHNHRIADAASADAGDGADSVSLHDFQLQAAVSDEIDPEALSKLFEDTFARVFRGEVENDDFNRLVLRAGLASDEIVGAARLRQIPASDWLCAFASQHRGHPGRAPAHRPHAGGPVQAALRPGRT